jgi:uncharacterized membrane protein
MRRLLWFTAFYTLALLGIAPWQSLWLDEVVTLVGAALPTWSLLVDNLRTQQGAVPLAFLLPHWSLAILGKSALAARLPSILASALSLPALYLIARRIGLTRPGVAVVLFAVWPLHFRYTLEARPYLPALCMTLWLTHAFLELDQASARIRYSLLTLAIAATHPYALVVPAAHFLWAYWEDRTHLRWVGVSIVAALVGLLPWYAYFASGWRAVSTQQQLAWWNPRAALVFVREISGAGYIGFAILLAALLIGKTAPIARRTLWWTLILLPMVAVPLANMAFDYFFAVRQMIFILPAVALLFASRRGWPAVILMGAFIVTSIYGNTMWLLRPREDWNAAAQQISDEIGRGACVDYIGTSQKVFTYFHDDLAGHACGDTATRVVVASSKYEPQEASAALRLEARGMTRQSLRDFNGPHIEVWAAR